MAGRLSLAAWAGFRPVRAPRVRRRRKEATPPTAEALRALAIERAHRCGLRYYVNGWRRRSPPRFGWVPYSHPDSEERAACRAAFLRGYDAGRAAETSRRRRWAESWPALEARA